VTAGQVPVYAGVIDTSTPRVIAQARAAATHRASAVVATAPFFSPTDATEFGCHFRAIHAAVDLPLIAYDIPNAVGAALPAELVGELARDGVLAAVKDSSGDLDALRELRDAAPDLRLYSGSETLADVSLQLGADGLVPGLGNVDPYGYLRLYRAATAGDGERAAAEQQRLRRLFGIIGIGDRHRMGRYSAAIGGFKEALVHRGIIRHGTTSLPMVPLNDPERDAVHRLLAETGIAQIGSAVRSAAAQRSGPIETFLPREHA
ncbi:MAG: dihydrodipicolinate synthase family protein, partial [Micromonosporaceae bacterium]